MPVPILIVALLVLGGSIALARRSAFRLCEDALRRLPVGRDGIIPGAHAIDLHVAGSAHAVLLLHGGGDTPQTLQYLAEYLHGNGYNVRAPLLPGHGRTVREFSHVAATAWMDAARTAHRDLTARNVWVGVIGLSMGGALAVRLAAADATIPALALLAPYLSMPRNISFAARFAALWGVAVPFVRALDPTARQSIHDPAEVRRSLAYGVFTPAALRALHTTVARAFEALPRVSSPTLMIQSREDNRIAPGDAEHAFERLGARDKQLIWITGAGHVITVDYGRDRVFELVADWLERHRGAAQRDRPA